MVDSTGFITSLVINVATAIVVFILFMVWRPKYPWCFDTRRNPKKRIIGVEPPPVPDGHYAWFLRTIRYTDTEVLATAGLDGLMFIKFFEMCATLFTLFCIFGVGILLPINFTSENDITDEFDKMSMSNIPQKSDLFWAHLIIAYVFCGFFYYLAYHLWQDYLNYRHQFLAKWGSIGGGHTVLIHYLPKTIRTDAALLAYFQKIFPGQIRSARMAKDLNMKVDKVTNFNPSLNENVLERSAIAAELERNIVTWEKTLADPKLPEEKKLRPQKALKCFCCSKVDAIDHNYAELERLNALIVAKKSEFARSKGNDVPTLLSAFVTFHSLKAAQSASAFVYDTEPYSFEVKAAPECRDVYWPSLNFTHTQRVGRSLFFNLLTGALIVFWMIPMGFLQGLSNLSELQQKYSWLDGINSIPTVILGFIEGFLPAIMIMVFLAIVPMILLAFSRGQGIEAHSWLQRSVLDKYFLFIVINFFFGAIIGSSIFGDIAALTEDVSNIPTVLGQTIPKVANYFVNYLALASFAGFPLQMAQVGRLIGGGIIKKYLAVTPHDFEEAEKAPELMHGVQYCNHLFIFIIAITYSFISPIIIPFAAIYFALGWVVYKYQIVHVFVQPFESGGVFWPIVYSRMSTCLLIAQLCLIGIFGLKEVPAQACLVIPMPIITLLFDRYIRTAIEAKLPSLPLETIVEIDATRKALRTKASADAQVGAPVTTKGTTTLMKGDSNENSPKSDQQEPSETEVVIMHAEPTEEKVNNGDVHTNESYLQDELSMDAALKGQAAVGFPYHPDEQNRAYVEGDLADYIQPELTPLVPDRIQVNRVEQYLTDGAFTKSIRVNASMKNVAKSEEEENV